MDNVTWQVLTAILTITGGVLSAYAWKRRGPASGIRGMAWTLLPLAAFLTGTLALVWEIGSLVVDWAVRLVFSPFVWLGILVAGVSATLFVVSSFMHRRGIGTKGRAPKVVHSDRSEKALPSRSGQAAEKSPAADDDMEDIEAILKKHGIS